MTSPVSAYTNGLLTREQFLAAQKRIAKIKDDFFDLCQATAEDDDAHQRFAFHPVAAEDAK